jgi:hypothetical protein
LPIRARFVPLHGRPDCSPDWCMPRIPVARFCAVLLALDGRPVLFVPAAGAGCRIDPRYRIRAATEAVIACASPLPGGRLARRRGERRCPRIWTLRERRR